MIRRPPRSTLSSSSAASDVYKRQGDEDPRRLACHRPAFDRGAGAGLARASAADRRGQGGAALAFAPPFLPELRRADANRACRLAARLRGLQGRAFPCLLYTSDAADE